MAIGTFVEIVNKYTANAQMQIKLENALHMR